MEAAELNTGFVFIEVPMVCQSRSLDGLPLVPVGEAFGDALLCTGRCTGCWWCGLHMPWAESEASRSVGSCALVAFMRHVRRFKALEKV